LTHKDLGAEDSAHNVRVERWARTGSAASTQWVFPRSGLNIQTGTLEIVFKWGEEHLTFLNTTFRLQQKRSECKIHEEDGIA
jgi:hypothetical protein